MFPSIPGANECLTKTILPPSFNALSALSGLVSIEKANPLKNKSHADASI